VTSLDEAQLGARELEERFGGRVLVASSSLTGELSDLFPEEQHVMERAVISRVREFATGRVLARGLLRRLGFSDAPIVPSGHRCPAWPAGTTGSISHTSDQCVVAVALTEDAASIGIDVEPFAPLETELFSIVFVESEQRWLDAQPSSQRGFLARALFSAKESYYKCQYPLTRRVLEFKDVEARLSVRGGTFTARCVGTVSGPSELESVVGSLSIADDRIVTGMMLRA
jgi:4'-phosphopantetheinyl transferase EntD